MASEIWLMAGAERATSAGRAIHVRRPSKLWQGTYWASYSYDSKLWSKLWQGAEEASVGAQTSYISGLSKPLQGPIFIQGTQGIAYPGTTQVMCAWGFWGVVFVLTDWHYVNAGMKVVSTQNKLLFAIAVHIGVSLYCTHIAVQVTVEFTHDMNPT